VTKVRAPYPGKLKLGSTGEPVKLMKRALRLAGFLPGKGKPTGFLGPIAVRQLRRFGNATSLPALEKPGVVKPGRRKVKAIANGGQYGPRTHVKLANYYDAYGASRLQAIRKARAVAAVNAAGIGACNLVITNRGSIHYTQSAARMSGVRNGYVPPQYGKWEDCSSESTWIAYVMDRTARRLGGSFPDPNGLGYNGQGYTGTMVTHGIPVNAYAGPSPRTAVFYGWPIGHVGWKKSMTRVMSHGSERGPRDEPVGYRTPTAARVYPLYLP
jgi:peptidoglycan hydrolase-like protein with peptidoglycan-binding domain